VKTICVVGAGRVGRLHTRNLTESLGGRAVVTAIVDPDQDRARELAAEYSVPRTFPSLDNALASASFDGAVITTPTFTHAREAVAALTAGLHVHLEKPMAMNLVECGQIRAAERKAGTAIQLGFMRRFDPDFTEAAALVASGEIGDPMILKSLTHGPGLPPAWATDIRTSNGMLAEVNSHDLDTVSWFADAEPTDISVRVANFKGAQRGVATPGFYDTLTATITYPTGTLAIVTGACPADYGYDSRLEVLGTCGMLQVGDTGPGGLSTIAGSAGQSTRLFRSWRDRFARAYAQEMTDFVAAMDGAPVRVGTKAGARAVALVLAGTLSLLEQRTVMLSEVTDDPVTPSWQDGN
jgi:myo-inositol 2-dehydrogenase/D-chiro-inositol 1-dehydrogenase/scyllo-inositol 2-dehydrogenase (NAD+)